MPARACERLLDRGTPLQAGPRAPLPSSCRGRRRRGALAGRERRGVGGAEDAVGVVGDSSGGNLAAVVAQTLARDGVPLSFQALIYPMLDATASSASYSEFASGYGFTREKALWYFHQYLPPEVDAQAPPWHA
jgi:acetyl esterase